MKKVPLFGSGVSAKSRVVSSQRRLNCYYEIRSDGDKSNIVVYGTPGLVLASSSLSGVIRGWHVMGGNLYVVSAGTLYRLNTNLAATSLGTLNTAAGFVSMDDNGTQLMIVDGTSGYIFNTSTSTFSVISSAGFPNGATSVAFSDGCFIVEKPGTGQFYKSASYDGTTWGASDFATLAASPGNLLAVDVDHGVLILWGQNSIEPWQDLGSPLFPFAPLRGSAQEYGLAAKWSRAKIGNTIIFLANNPQGGSQVMMLNGFNPVDIGSPDISNIISGFSTVVDAVALSYVVDGHAMYQITFPSGGRSFLYDMTTGMWSETQTGVSLTGTHLARLGINFNGFNYACDGTTGNIYQFSSSAYTDNGTPIKRMVQTRHVFEDYNILGVSEVFLDMETGVGLQNGQGSNPQVMMQISKDGGRTFTQERWVSIGLVGQYVEPRAYWRRCGSGRDFVFRFTMTDPVKFVITGGAIDPIMKPQSYGAH